ncbi:IFT46 [Lepeophtheirus salmonis]|uniref:Intraflagellar transport protein 46 homolog n=2 Tax=Lepeophtheirus salmonis TaxID=72036 RepID=A0A7R8CS83_LEPSM|nr:intraflagellar transport protein 46 homolog [Lepeophtheirus salmonis]CAB4062849.1 IFT46 [Lepeophtheirus salmonis]CAF2912418.1 IFT46 [Lepeophtheirus salmonis]
MSEEVEESSPSKKKWFSRPNFLKKKDEDQAINKPNEEEIEEALKVLSNEDETIQISSDDKIEDIIQYESPLKLPDFDKSEEEEELGEEDDEEDEEEDEEEEEEEEDEEGDDVNNPPVEGMYDPSEYEDLNVDSEVKELFNYILRYTPQTIELETKFKPFIPEYIPAVGDIDAFIKVSRPDEVKESLGLTVLDEPAAKQSDPSVLDLQLRAISKQTSAKAATVKKVPGDSGKNSKHIDKWIKDISDLHRSKPPPTVHYSKTMPEIDSLMQEWPSEVETLLRKGEVDLPNAELDSDLETYVDIACSLLDIPIYKSRIQSLHVLASLYIAFKNSQHFATFSEKNE